MHHVRKGPSIIDIKGKTGTVNMISSEETKESFMPIKRASVKDVRKTKTRTAYNTEHTAKTKLALDMARKSDYAPEKVVDAVKPVSYTHLTLPTNREVQISVV